MAKLPDLMKPDTPFNMAVMWLARLDERLDEANTASLQGNLLTWYRSLRIIYRMVHWKVKEAGNEKLEEELNEEFKNVKNMVRNTFGQGSNTQLQEMYLTDLEIELDKLETKLNDLMAEYKLVLPPTNRKKYNENIQKFIDIYVKKSVLKKAIADPAYMKKHAPEMYNKFLDLVKKDADIIS